MKFNRESESDRFAKNQLKNQTAKHAKKAAKSAFKKMGGKAGKAAGEAAGKATQAAAKKIISLVISAVGGVGGAALLIGALVVLVLPSLIFSSTLGIDGANSAEEASGIVDSSWEADAQNAIDERYRDLQEATFWADLGNFFSTGEWGTERHFFETEYANARDLDEEGADGYFSASNRLIAIINETFRLSLKYGRVLNDAAALANASKPNIESQYRSTTEYGPNGIAEGDYTITLSVAQDPNFSVEEGMNYIYQSCYLLAASSASINESEDYATGIRELLDYTFAITGLDGDVDTTICMEPIVRSTCVSCVVENHQLYYAYDQGGYTFTYTNQADIPEDQTLYRTDSWQTKDVGVDIYYSAELADNWKDIINEHCNIETTLPSDAQSFEITQEQQVETSALQLANFYIGGTDVSIGEAGLPLPRDSYYISSRFGWRTLNGAREFHLGIDLATYHQTPPVYTVKDGVCTAAGYSGSYGNRVIIDHGNGLTTLYAHMSAITVSVGQTVTAGEQIGFVGSTGNSSGEHLHFEIRLQGNQTDPLQTELGPQITEAARA